jgi:hypothetical protein
MPDERQTNDPETNEPAADPPAAVQWMMQQAAAGQSTAALSGMMDELPVAALAPASSEAKLAAREQRIIDALRGNERLTAGLDDSAAASLLEWGQEMGRRIVHDTAGLGDAAAEDVLQPRVRAVRRLMMAVTEALTGGDIPATEGEWLDQASIALGDAFRPPDADEQRALVAEWRATAGLGAERIAVLRRFIALHTAR